MMADRSVGDYFISDADETLLEDDDLLGVPLIMPMSERQDIGQSASRALGSQPGVFQPEGDSSRISGAVSSQAVPSSDRGPQSASGERVESVSDTPRIHSMASSQKVSSVQSGVRKPATREQQLVRVLNELMHNDTDIQAAALVSLDGFTMASALPAGMEADRVGAMSAAILGLGERVATELGRGRLSQVFIEGDNGFVLLMAAGERAVLTVLAEKSAKLGLVLYDMKATAESIGQILG